MDALAAQSWEAICQGSKSFSAAARLLDPSSRESASMLYAWCRYCDDVIDDQTFGHGQAGRDWTPRERLAHLEDQTRRALAGSRVTDPAFAALQTVISRHDIPDEHPLELIAGFAMDVEGRTYRSLEDTLAYCYHVAGVVGVMMARVMGVRDADTLNRAADLGLAFQLTNIARDVIDDALIGRIYLPLDWLAARGIAPEALTQPSQRDAIFAVTAQLLAVAEPYYRSALDGIARLPIRSAWAIATARAVYRRIGSRVLRLEARAWDQRVVVPKHEKALFAAAEGARVAWLVTARPWRRAAPRQGLWTRFD